MTLPQQPASQHFLLKWNNHRSNMVSVFESLLQSENLVDVTLAVEGKFLKGHKIVLSACSPYFESMFVNQTPGEKHPILIFHDMKFSHLKTLLDFMYRGEISIDEKDLSDVLKVAEALSIRGLSSFESDDEDSEKSCEQNDNQAQGNSNSGSNSNCNSNMNSCNNNNSNSSSSSSSNSSLNNGGLNTPGVNGNNNSGYNINNNSASINSNENNNQTATQNQNDNHCISSGNMNCDSSVNGSLNNSKNQGKNSARGQKNKIVAAGSFSPPPPPPPVVSKRRRGRQPIRKETFPAPSRASTFKQPPIDKFPPNPPEVKSSLSNRQRVRRRIPKFQPSNSVVSTIKNSSSRIKIEKHSDAEERGSVNMPEDDEMDTSDFIVPEIDGASAMLPVDICNSEPLSEMSVRGLDLFKYASIENGVYRCNECEKMCIPKTFKNKYSFQRHAFLYHEGNMRKVFPCPVCNREFSRPDKMKNHLRSIHEGGKNARHNNNNGAVVIHEQSTGADSNGSNKCDG